MKACSIKVYGCENLPKINDSTPNAYAVIVASCMFDSYLGSTKAKRSQNPEWNQKFKFDFCLANTIEIQIVHKKFGYDIDIGIATVDLLKVQSGDKIPVPIRPLTKESFSSTVYVSVKFRFPDLKDKDYDKYAKHIFVTSTFDPPIRLPPNAPMPVKLRCLAYDKFDNTFKIFDERSYGFDRIVSSGNKMVFTGTGFSQVFILSREFLHYTKVLFLVESDSYDGIVTINIGTKRYMNTSYFDCGPSVFVIEGLYQHFRSIQMEVSSKQYISSPIYLSFNSLKMLKGKGIQVHDNHIMTINPGENPYLFEYNVALQLGQTNNATRRNIVSSIYQMKLFPYLLQKSNNIRFVTAARNFGCKSNAYVFNSSGSCIFGNEKVSENIDEPIYFTQKESLKGGHFPMTKEFPMPYFFDLHINLAKFSEPGTTIFITGEYHRSTNFYSNIDNFMNVPFLFIGDNDNDFSYGKFPIIHYKLFNHACDKMKKKYPVILFSLSFDNGEWIYTPIDEKLKNLEKETITNFAINHIKKNT